MACELVLAYAKALSVLSGARINFMSQECRVSPVHADSGLEYYVRVDILQQAPAAAILASLSASKEVLAPQDHGLPLKDFCFTFAVLGMLLDVFVSKDCIHLFHVGSKQCLISWQSLPVGRSPPRWSDRFEHS